MGWKATVWVHWTVCHSGWFAWKYRTLSFFSSVPTERRNLAHKVHLQNRFREWSVKNQRVCVRGMRRLLNMYGLDVGSQRVRSPSTGTGRGQKRKRSEYHGFGEVSFVAPLVHVQFQEGGLKSHLTRGS